MPSSLSQLFIFFFWSSLLVATENSDCPCIQPDLSAMEEGPCLVLKDDIGDKFCYPKFYGMRGCQKYDLWYNQQCAEGSLQFSINSPPKFTNETDYPDTVHDIWVSNFWSSSEFPPVSKNFSVVNHEKLPSFCSEPWCFVDPNNCNYASFGADHFGTVCDASGGFAKVTSRVHYSYETCGGKYFPYSSFLRESTHFVNIRGKMLRTAMIDYKPFIYDASPEDERPQLFGKTGYTVGMLYEIMKILKDDFAVAQPSRIVSLESDPDFGGNSTYKIVDARGRIVFGFISVEVPPQEETKNPWRSCGYAAAKGQVDFCLSGFWESKAYRTLTAVTTPILSDAFSLVVRKQSVPYGLYEVFKFAHPFSNDVWVCILLVIVLVGVTMWFIERGQNTEDYFHYDRAMQARRLRQQKSLNQYNWKIIPNGVSFPTTDSHPTLHGTIRGCYLAFISLFNASVMFNPKSTAARWLALGYSLFIFVMTSSYTANLTTALVTDAQTTSISSIESALSIPNTKICSWPSRLSSFKKLYPKHKDAFIEIEDLAHTISDDLDYGRCVGFLTSHYDAHFAIAGGFGGDRIHIHCNKAVLDKALLPISVILLLNPRLREVSNALSFFIVSVHSSTVSEQLKKDFITIEGQSCSSAETKQAITDGEEKTKNAKGKLAEGDKVTNDEGLNKVKGFNSYDVLGVYLIFLIFGLVGVLYALRKSCREAAALKKESLSAVVTQDAVNNSWSLEKDKKPIGELRPEDGCPDIRMGNFEEILVTRLERIEDALGIATFPDRTVDYFTSEIS